LLLKLGVLLFQLGNPRQSLRELHLQLGHFPGQISIMQTA